MDCILDLISPKRINVSGFSFLIIFVTFEIISLIEEFFLTIILFDENLSSNPI